MAKIYATYRRKILNDSNWWYTPSHFFDKMFADYKAAWLTSIHDTDIMENQYTWELVPWVPKLTRFLVAEYDDKYVTQEEFNQSLAMLWWEFNLRTQTVKDARAWIKENTSLVEDKKWVFVISPEIEVNWETIPKKYLIID